MPSALKQHYGKELQISKNTHTVDSFQPAVPIINTVCNANQQPPSTVCDYHKISIEQLINPPCMMRAALMITRGAQGAATKLSSNFQDRVVTQNRRPTFKDMKFLHEEGLVYVCHDTLC